MRVRKNMKMSERLPDGYRDFLLDKGRSAAAVEKYLRDVRIFLGYMGEAALDRKWALDYKQGLKERYKITGTNSTLMTMNSFFVYLGREDLKVELFKVQRTLHVRPKWETTEEDYRKLIQAARNDGDEMMSVLIQTTGSTGARISELKFIMMESPASGRMEVYNKGKSQTVLLPIELGRVLRKYCRKVGIVAGGIFITRRGNPVDRSNVSKKTEALGRAVEVDMARAFPRDLRHLFARIFYSIEEDVVRPMDLLRHSGISTTKIYTVNTGEQSRRQMSRMKLVLSQSRQAER